MLFQEPLESFIALNIILLQSQYLEGLLLCHEATFDTKSFLGYLLAALVGELLGLVLVMLLVDEPQDPLMALTDSQWTDHLLKS